MGYNTYSDICRTKRRRKNLSYKKIQNGLQLQTVRVKTKYMNDIYIEPLKHVRSDKSKRATIKKKTHTKIKTIRFCKKKANVTIRKERKELMFWKCICKLGLKKYQILTVCLAGEQCRCEVAEIKNDRVFLFVEGRSYNSMADVGYYSLKNIKKMVKSL
jgi:hypothetical protein